ncbi:MAG: hypothetical protein AAGA81_04540 [Acidobacteriota bacterium]
MTHADSLDLPAHEGVSGWLRELHRRDPLLSWVGWLHVVLALAALVLMSVDGRQITGVNAWVKPFKFCLSITIYCWTVGWLLEHLRHRPRWARVLSIGVAVSMVIEIACILVQAARGTTSHYNVSSAFDIAVFSTMGNLIAVNTLLAVAMLWLFFRRGTGIESTYLWGIRAGLCVFLLGSAAGGQMIALGAHTVGAPDGGPGMPLLDWSRIAGDLRIAHGLGLHALQALPLAGFWLGRAGKPRLFAGFTGLYVAALAALYLQAMAGIPLLPN